jgi:hypothetical protein
MRRFQSIDRSHRSLKRSASSRFLHELGDFGPDLDAIRMLFDWLVTGGQVVATHVVRAQRSLNLGQEPPHVVRYVSLQNS